MTGHDEKLEPSTMMVVDGLGHGPEAAKVAAEATRLFDKYWRSGPMETLRLSTPGCGPRGEAPSLSREWSGRQLVSAMPASATLSVRSQRPMHACGE